MSYRIYVRMHSAPDPAEADRLFGEKISICAYDLRKFRYFFCGNRKKRAVSKREIKSRRLRMKGKKQRQ